MRRRRELNALSGERERARYAAIRKAIAKWAQKAVLVAVPLAVLASSGFEIKAQETAAATVGQEKDAVISFRQQIVPVLIDQCYDCHNADLPEGGFRVDSYEQLLRESDGGLAIVNGEPSQSPLIDRLETDDTSLRMPLDAEPLETKTVSDFHNWIEQGMPFDGFDRTADIALLLPTGSYQSPPETYLHSLPISALAFSPDGKELWVGGYHELLVWDWRSGELLQRVDQIGQRTRQICFAPQGDYLVVAGGSPGKHGEVVAITMNDRDDKKRLFVSRDEVLAIAHHPAQPRLAVAGIDRRVTLIDVAANRPLWQSTSHSDWVVDVRWDREGKRLLSASRDQSAKVFDATNGKLLTSYAGHNEALTGAIFLPSGEPTETSAISVGISGDAHRWNISSNQREKEISLGRKPLRQPIQLKKEWAAGGDLARLMFVDYSLEKRTHTFPELEERITGLAVSSDGSLFAIGLSDGTVVVVDPIQRKELQRLQALPVARADE